MLLDGTLLFRLGRAS